MNNNQFTEVVLGLLDECKELLVKKGEDYSTNADRLDNFKSAEQFTSLTQWQCWEALFFKHIQAIRSYFKSGRKALNEDIHHRIRDSINYLILLEAMLEEERIEGDGSQKQFTAASYEEACKLVESGKLPKNSVITFPAKC